MANQVWFDCIQHNSHDQTKEENNVLTNTTIACCK